MSPKNPDRHIFALYYDRTSFLRDAVGKSIAIEDKALHHRIVHVLRFLVGSHCILFDKTYRADIVVEKINKKTFEVLIVSLQANTLLYPHIALLLPVLKRQALAEAVYAAVEAGVSDIQLVATQKVQRSWGGQKELERLQAVVIAASEQAKHFTIPDIKAPIILESALSSLEKDALRVFYDAAGSSFTEISLQDSKKAITVLVGPEGDLSAQEKQMVADNNFISIHLTPTILRSPQAVTLGIGILRTVYNDSV